MKKNQKGFTLVELIVVIAIAAILSGIAVPTYIAYIDEANKAADQQLASDVGYSIKTASKLPASAIKSGDYMVIGSDGVDKASGLNTSGGSESHDANSAAEAVYGDFGALTGSTQVKLKYDKWGEESAAASVYGVYKDSTFNKKESALLDDVQNVTYVFKNFIEDGGLDAAGPGFESYMNKLGAGTETEIANAAALYVAERTAVINGDDTVDAFVGAWKSPLTLSTANYQASVLSLLNSFSAIRGSDNTSLGVMGAAAAGYAMGEAMVQYLDAQSGSDKTELPSGYDSLSAWYAEQNIYNEGDSSANDVFNNLSVLFASTVTNALKYNPDAVQAYYTGGQAENDAKAYIAAMSAINESSSLLSEDLSKDNMYSDGTVYNYLTGYLTAGKVLSELGENVKGKIVVIVTGEDQRQLNTVCYPIDYVQ